MSPSPKDQGGDPALQTATTHMFTSLEPDGHLVMLLDSFNQEALKSFELGKGLGDHDHVKEACSSTACRQTKPKEKQPACSSTACRQTEEQTKEEQTQLDQARLQERSAEAGPQLTAKA